MGNPVQNPGYFGNQPSNYSENDQLNELEKSETRAYQSVPSPDPTPLPYPDAIPSNTISPETNIFDAVTGAYQTQVTEGNVGVEYGGTAISNEQGVDAGTASGPEDQSGTEPSDGPSS